MFDNDPPENEETNDASAFSGLYKYSTRTMSFTLEKKRHLFLEKQKEKRNEAFDEKRDLNELFQDNESEMECDLSKQTKKKPFFYKMMGSEWFMQIPDDLNENWLVKFCPEGVRFLVIANKASTACYYRNGKVNKRFKSKLPGGDCDNPHKFTVLDCVYNKEINTIFVFDVLAWNSTSLLNAEAQMRFFFLKSKFEEQPELGEINKQKNFHFVLMDFIPADKSIIQEKFFIPFVINNSELSYDGVLFYHRQGHYIYKKSPLVGWLRSFMVPEILNIDVHPLHLKGQPENYNGIEDYLKRKKGKTKEVVEVEMEEIIDIDD